MVIIQDGKISGLNTSGAPPPEGAKVFDFGSEACLLPGLIDAHVHPAFDASADVVKSLAAFDDNALLEHMQAASIRALRAGVTTVRDLGDRNYRPLGAELRKISGAVAFWTGGSSSAPSGDCAPVHAGPGRAQP